MRVLSFCKIVEIFTLTEVLITLVIVGVIAAITVPTLITKYQKEQTVTRLKKAYSTLSQTTLKAIADYGPIKTWDILDENSADTTKIFVNKYITPYLNTAKPAQTREEGNWNTTYYYMNGSRRDYDDSVFVRFYLSDGTSYTLSYVLNETVNRYQVWVDINGDKKPNKIGRDIFLYYYNIINTPDLAGKFIPEGYGNERSYMLEEGNYKCHKNSDGCRCAVVIMKDGWQIKDDYPWQNTTKRVPESTLCCFSIFSTKSNCFVL